MRKGILGSLEVSRILGAIHQECQEGRCSCPTQEYSKLESLEIESNEDTIRLKLKSKPDEQLDESEIGKCLEYTKGKVMDEN
jgi:hypothetical protein